MQFLKFCEISVDGAVIVVAMQLWRLKNRVVSVIVVSDLHLKP